MRIANVELLNEVVKAETLGVGGAGEKTFQIADLTRELRVERRGTGRGPKE